MYKEINKLIYCSGLEHENFSVIDERLGLDSFLNDAMVKGKQEAHLEVQRSLFQLNLAELACSWESNFCNVKHPYIVAVKHKIETALERYFMIHHQEELSIIDEEDFGLNELITYIRLHPSSQVHPLDTFLKEKASLKQFKAFLFQESPLEMLFGDILCFMLPGVYGEIKMEILKNYWDEMGNGKMQKIHRNLRAKLMKKFELSDDCYSKNTEELILESLKLINLYLSMATNRSKHMRLMGVLLATELSVGNHFEYQLAGLRRLGIDEACLDYYKIHISIDDEHSQDWIDKVVQPILNKNPNHIKPIGFGAIRRLLARDAFVKKLYEHISVV